MTTREIANAVGKDETTVRRWIKKLTGKMPVITGKMSSSSPMNPADYDFEETIAIIATGLGKNAADVYRNNALNIAPVQKTEYVTKDDLKEFAKTIITEMMVIIRPLIDQSAIVKSKQLAYVPESDQRTELNRLIKTYAFEHSVDQHSCWTKLYNDVYDRLHLDIRARAKNASMDRLDYATQEGLIPQFITIVMGW
jgi:phage regulator Rha-like protein